MADVPLPASPCVRVNLVYEPPAANKAGSRFYVSYSGTAPDPTVCATLAGLVHTNWASHMAPVTPANWSLNEVDVLDIATRTGKSGQWTGAEPGTRTGTELPTQVASNVEFDIAERYRGGKPRMYCPPGVAADGSNENEWASEYITAFNTAITDFFAGINGSSPGSMGTLQHVVLSYYHGKNTATPPWRGPGYKYPPLYRDAAVLYTVEGYGLKAVMGSQRRRRTSTSA